MSSRLNPVFGVCKSKALAAIAWGVCASVVHKAYRPKFNVVCSMQLVVASTFALTALDVKSNQTNAADARLKGSCNFALVFGLRWCRRSAFCKHHCFFQLGSVQPCLCRKHRRVCSAGLQNDITHFHDIECQTK